MVSFTMSIVNQVVAMPKCTYFSDCHRNGDESEGTITGKWVVSPPRHRWWYNPGGRRRWEFGGGGKLEDGID
ncbi:unnamed protein product [Taenia asiatica]|uniref:Secreted protein n=1 Tax=Taenia asiatica TaxID=60517 RepID=A0A0R3VZN5_TAEAS|nr:unnamed protein product [Taenia asiatica]